MFYYTVNTQWNILLLETTELKKPSVDLLQMFSSEKELFLSHPNLLQHFN